MAFPQTGVLDSFNAGGGQALTSRAGWAATHIWSADTGWTTDAVPTYATPSGADSDAHWVLNSADAEVWTTFNTWVGGGTYVLYTRITSPGGTTPSAYVLTIDTAWRIIKVVAGVFTTLATITNPTISNGDSVGFRTIGPRLEGFYKSGAGLWVPQGSVVDSSITAAGNIGLESTTATRVDAFGGGIPVEKFAASAPDKDTSRAQDRRRYQGSPSRVFSVFMPTAIPAGGVPLGAVARKVDAYRGSYSAISGAADEAIPSDNTDWASVVQSRSVPFYKGPPDFIPPVFAPAAVAPDGFTPPTQSKRLVSLPRTLSQTITAYASTIPDAWASIVQDARPSFYGAPRSFTIPVWDPATNTFADWVPPALLSRIVRPYSPPAAQPQIAWGQSVITDAYAPFAADRSSPAYAPLRSLVTGVFFAPAIAGTDYVGPIVSRQVSPYVGHLALIVNAFFAPPVISSTDFVALIASRAVAPYAGSWSAVMGAADEAIPSDSTDWASVIASRVVASYRGSADFIANVYAGQGAAPVATWTPGVIRSRLVAAYRGAPSTYWVAWDDHACTTLLPDTMLGPDTLLFPDLCPQVELGFVIQGRVVPFYRGAPSGVIAVYDTTSAAFQGWTPGVIQSRIGVSRPMHSLVVAPGTSLTPDSFAPGAFQPPVARAPQRGSVILPPWVTSVSPDAMAFVAQQPAGGVSRARPSAASPPVTTAAPAQGYVAVARSAPTLRALAHQSLTILPQGDFFVVTQQPSGGGGEWVIWEKPNFPANRRDAWPSFVPPYFRKPSRPVKRGY